MQSTANTTAETLFAEAQAHEESGRFDEAEALYRRLLAMHPGQPLLMARLALVLKARGDLVEAERLLRRAILAAPREAALHNNLGNVLRNAGRFGDAEASYRRAVALNPTYAEAFYNLGAVLEEAARGEEALTAYQQAVALQRDYPAAQVRIAAILIERQEAANAVAQLDAVLAKAPATFEAHYYRGLALARLEQFDAAVASLERAAELRPESQPAWAALANSLKGASRFEQALDAYARLIEIAPNDVAAHDEMSRLAWMAGHKERMFASFAQVRAQRGDDPALLTCEAQLRMQRGNAAAAEPLLRRAIELAPEQADANAMLGLLLSRDGRHQESFASFVQAIRLAPERGTFRNEFGYALLKGQEPKRALEQFERARGLNPADQMALSGVCLSYRALGDSRYHRLVNFDSFVRVYPLRVPAGFADAAAFNVALAEELSALHTTTAEPLEQTLRGGTQTAGLLFERKSRMIQHVREQIAAAVEDYIRAMPADSSHPLLSRKADAFSFTHSWSCKLRSSGYHTNHVHPMGWISSAYYVSLPDELRDQNAREGWLKFGESHLALGDDDRPEHFVQPAVGHLALFPSYFWHGTVPFSSSQDRLTVAFDVLPGQVDPKALRGGPY